MPKSINELFAIEERINPTTLEKRFFREGTDKEIPKEEIKVLAYPPILVTKPYADFQQFEQGKVPEEANAILLGQKSLIMRKIMIGFYPASYCKVEEVKERKRYTLRECNHRFCDCHMAESPRGEYYKVDEK